MDGRSDREEVLAQPHEGRDDLVEADHQVCQEIRLAPTPGHTPGHVSIRVDSGDDQAVFSGDVFHHPVQYAEPAWNSNFCIVEDEARATRLAFLDRYAESTTVILPGHFATPAASRIGRSGDAFRFIEVEA